MTAVKTLPVSGVILPKSESADNVAAVCDQLAGHAPVIALIESAQGLAEVRHLARIKGVERLTFGSIDFCADLGCAHVIEVLLPARLELVLASRLAGIAGPLDGVTALIDDTHLVSENAVRARKLGVAGKLCIHPRQIAPVIQAFLPSPSEIEWAMRVLDTGSGVASVDGEMVDAPVRLNGSSSLKGAMWRPWRLPRIKSMLPMS